MKEIQKLEDPEQSQGEGLTGTLSQKAEAPQHPEAAVQNLKTPRQPQDKALPKMATQIMKTPQEPKIASADSSNP